MHIDKKWEIHDLNSIDLTGEDDVTKSVDTLTNFFIIIWATIAISPMGKYNLSYALLLSILIGLLFSWIFTKENFHSEFINFMKDRKKNYTQFLRNKNFFLELKRINKVTLLFFVLLSFSILIQINSDNLTIFLAITALYAIIKLIFNRNFILYDILYKLRLKIKFITIEENLSPFSPLLLQFERIILGLNKNNDKQSDVDLKESIIFFWIRKDKEKNRKRSVKQFIPFLSLITILFVLKEKRYKFVAIVGVYFSIIGILFIAFHSYFIEKLECDQATVSVITIFVLMVWYLLTIYNIFKLIDISKYIQRINNVTRRAKLKEDFNFAKGYSGILEIFDRDNAIYIYDYTTDKYQHINRRFLFNNLNRSKKFIEKNIGHLITIIISMVLVVMVEITANGVFQSNAKSPTSNNTIEKKIQQIGAKSE